MAQIPPEFFNSESETPFNTCTMCGIELLEIPQHYVIEKAYRQYPGQDVRELIYEIAICNSCLEESRKAMSEESLQRIQEYTRRFEKQSYFLENLNNEPANRCIFTGKEKEEMDEYKIIGMFYGPGFHPGTSSYLISGKIMQEFSELLSPKTRDAMKRFKQHIFDTPPELKELFDDYDLIFV